MTDLPPKSPIDIRALALYDIHQWKTTEQSYKNYEKLCGAMGDEAISYEEYEKWFNKYLEESYYSTRDGSSRGLPIPDIRGCILSNVINGKTAEKSIEDLCDAFKFQYIDKKDHDFWCKRFGSGHFSRVTFSDFPEDVLAEIVEKCDIKSYFNLRNVSYGLRTVIDQLAPPCTDIGVRYGNAIMIYSNVACISDPKFFDKTVSQASSKLVEVLSLKALEHFLKNPKFRLKCFEIVLNRHVRKHRNYKKRVLGLFSSLEHKIHIEKCMICVDNEKELIGVLKCLKPGTLEKLSINTGFSMDGINEVVKMDQWKLAKHLKIKTFVLPSIENFFHFPSFELQGPAITVEDVVKLCENLPKSSAFEHCNFRIQEKDQYIEEDERDRSIPDIRGCILSDVINGKSAEKSIKNLCNAFKDHKIDKEDHAYWYNRFGSGHLFSRITFSNLSDYVIGKIVEKCDIKSYLNLRNVSFGLRAIADQLPPPCTHIEFDNTEVDCPDVIVNGERIVEWDVLKEKNSSLQMEVIEKRVLGVLEPLLRNPKLRLKDFEFYTYSRFWFEGDFLYTDAVIKLLNSLDHKIHTESCSIFAEIPKDLMDILRCFKPGTLEQMSISQGFEQNYINEIAEMDQWKQAKHLELRVFGDGGI